MRRVKKSVVVVTMMLFSMMLFSMTNVHAANKKLKVNKVYTTTKKIKGKTKKKYLVKVKIGKKIYKKKASSKGNFTIPIPKQKVGKKLTVKAYRKKNKKWKLYAKKTITVKKKTVKATTKSKYPGKEDAIDFEQVKKDLAIGKEIHKADLGIGKGKYYYSVNYGSCKGSARVGYVDDYIYVDTDGEFVTLKPLNGATLYYTVAGANALFASAILCISSFFFTDAPVLLEASRSSFARRSSIVLSPLLREKVVIQRSANACLLSGLTSIGT